MRTLQTNERPTRLARALEELSRIVKALYLLAYIGDEAYRRRILNQLNRDEGRHQLARVVSTANAANCASAIARARKTISASLGS
jgi:TnpA family transposase